MVWLSIKAILGTTSQVKHVEIQASRFFRCCKCLFEHYWSDMAACCSPKWAPIPRNHHQHLHSWTSGTRQAVTLSALLAISAPGGCTWSRSQGIVIWCCMVQLVLSIDSWRWNFPVRVLMGNGILLLDTWPQKMHWSGIPAKLEKEGRASKQRPSYVVKTWQEEGRTLKGWLDHLLYIYLNIY